MRSVCFHSGQNENRDRCPTEQPFPVPVSFVRQLRYLEAVKVSDGKAETIESLKKIFTEN